ncbi:MOSC domain-containing protein [Mucilaginibacter ginsenosidivorans]|uniref:MOSC domain-containing protein n=2 Tax=Mucilaginibacter ginsenosidivorans TaxID=398053 RepID=A0A5B8UZR6_9SPHI|nr:MOSC N-terminal beta barrel domain-containing protein [Mucilaginibacter ginsenosidivorans]QEC64418.1 MOSC domain-containing protein [Mucilaginibacter ginsenosidivorans]
MLQISQLYIYPIKSMAGISVSKAKVTDRGFEYDRRWMLVDANNMFLSQREVPEMALMDVVIVAEGLQVSYRPDNSPVIVPLTPATDEFAEVTVWDDTCTGQFVGAEIDRWFSTKLNTSCRLVYMPDGTKRITDQRYAPENSITSFSDGYPFLIIGQASLNDLNSRLGEPIPMNRFRPNIVFTGGEPFGEDLMHTFTVGDIEFRGVKLCARCPIPTIDQQTLERGKEPLKTLARYRFKDNKILFGQNLVHNGRGNIAVGDELQVKQLNHEERFFISAR